MRCGHLEEDHLRHVVLEQPIERPLVVPVPLSRDCVELNVQLPLRHDRELVAAVEDGAAVHLAVLAHEFTRLAFVHARVRVLVELGRQKVLEMVSLHLLQAHDVCAVGKDLTQDVAPPEVPRQRPGGTVRVRVGRRINLGQQVVREQREPQPARVRARRAWLAEGDDNIVAHEHHAARLRRRRRRDDVARLERLGNPALGPVHAERDHCQLEHVPHVVWQRRVAQRVRHLDPLLLGRDDVAIDAETVQRGGRGVLGASSTVVQPRAMLRRVSWPRGHEALHCAVV